MNEDITKYNFITLEAKSINLQEVFKYCKKLNISLFDDPNDDVMFLSICIKDYTINGHDCGKGIIYYAQTLLDVDLLITQDELFSGNFDYIFSACKLNLI